MITIFLFSLLNLFSPHKERDWNQLTALTFYSHIQPDDINTIKEDVISKMPSKNANLLEAKQILTRCEQKKERFLWKGSGRLAVATFSDGTKTKLLISSYGGFFYDSDVKGQFVFNTEDRAQWYKLIEKYAP